MEYVYMWYKFKCSSVFCRIQKPYNLQKLGLYRFRNEVSQKTSISDGTYFVGYSVLIDEITRHRLPDPFKACKAPTPQRLL